MTPTFEGGYGVLGGWLEICPDGSVTHLPDAVPFGEPRVVGVTVNGREQARHLCGTPCALTFTTPEDLPLGDYDLFLSSHHPYSNAVLEKLKLRLRLIPAQLALFQVRNHPMPQQN